MNKIYRGIHLKFHVNMCKDPEQSVTELIGTCKRTDQEHIKLSTRAHERTHRNKCKDPQEHAKESIGACMDPGEYIQEIRMCFDFSCRLGIVRWTGKANRSVKTMPEHPVAMARQATQCSMNVQNAGRWELPHNLALVKPVKSSHTTVSFTSL
jgi:hypothetical protein